MASLRPRLLAVELLGVVCCEATPTAQLMEALLSLLYQSVFTSPSQLTEPASDPTTHHADQDYQTLSISI